MALFRRLHATAWVIWRRDVTFLLSGARNGQKIAMISQFCDIIFPPDDVSSRGALVAPVFDWVTYFLQIMSRSWAWVCFMAESSRTASVDC